MVKLPKVLQSNREGDSGFILVLVLWATVLLALMAAGFASAVRTDVRAATTAREIARAEALADGGINLALLDLVAARGAGPASARFSPGGARVACRVADDAVLDILVEDEAGKINLNLARDGLLQQLFGGLGATPDEAASYASRIIDFRDADGDARSDGGERDDYAAAGVAIGPKNRPFETIDELDQVLGISSELAAQAKPYVTLSSGIEGIDKAVATPALQALLDAASLQSVGGGLGTLTDTSSQSVRSNGRAFTIHALARLPSGVVYVAKAIVEFPDRLKSRYVLREWHRGNAATFSGAQDVPAEDIPPC